MALNDLLGYECRRSVIIRIDPRKEGSDYKIYTDEKTIGFNFDETVPQEVLKLKPGDLIGTLGHPFILLQLYSPDGKPLLNPDPKKPITRETFEGATSMIERARAPKRGWGDF